MSEDNQDSQDSIDNIKDTLARQEAEKELAELTSPDVNSEVTPTDTKNEGVSKTETTAEKSSEVQYTDLEKEQMEHGWKPDKEGGVSAAEFKRVGEIIEAKRKASKEAMIKSKEVEELTKTVRSLVEQNRAVEKATREKTLKEIADKQRQAVEDGDVQAFDQAKAEYDLKLAESVKAETIQQPTEMPPVSAEVQSFQEKNKEWLNGTKPSDLAMQAYVKARVAEYMKNDPNVEEKVAIASIEEGLAEEFPTKFTNPNKTKPSMTLKSTASSSSDTTSYSTSRLDMNQRVELSLIQKADPTYTTQEYIKSLEASGRLNK